MGVGFQLSESSVGRLLHPGDTRGSPVPMVATLEDCCSRGGCCSRLAAPLAAGDSSSGESSERCLSEIEPIDDADGGGAGSGAASFAFTFRIV